MIETIKNNNLLFAIILRVTYRKEGIEFFSNHNDSQQLGYMFREKEYVILPHRHNLITRNVHMTQEVLFIKSGKVRVDFYDNDQQYFKSTILNTGDVILLSDGGHGFKLLESSEIIEVKQGPYIGELDKIRFKPIEDSKLIII
jgi:mannose-6-phosphate isomerase-like protein (cupin superfamily)